MFMKSFTLQQIQELTGAKLVGDAKKVITGVANLDAATANDISFCANPRYLKALQASNAGAIFVTAAQKSLEGKNLFICEDPSLAFQKILDQFFGNNPLSQSGFNGIHPSAVIHPSAKIGANVTIGPLCVIDQETVVGQGSIIHAGCKIGSGVTIGEECLLHPNVVIRELCVLGNRIILQPGVVIGGCGFGYQANKKGEHIKLAHYGKVIIEDDVEIGANTTIDRGRFQATTIKKGTKIDNHVQIAHNTTIGAHNIIVAQTAIAGSVTTGSHVIIGGQVAIDGHLTIESGTMLAGRSAVTKSLEKGVYSGAPAQPINKFNRMIAIMRNLESYIKQLHELSAKVEKAQ